VDKNLDKIKNIQFTKNDQGIPKFDYFVMFLIIIVKIFKLIYPFIIYFNFFLDFFYVACNFNIIRQKKFHEEN